jgi:hypothetical protein
LQKQRLPLNPWSRQKMLRVLFGLLLGVMAGYQASLSSISIVYNFRIAQITKQPITGVVSEKKHMVLGLLFDQYQKQYNGVQQNFAGGLASYIYEPRPYYLRIDGAVSHIHEKSKSKTTFSGTETDDILFSFGRNFIPSDHTKVTVSGLFGIPTHKVYRLQHVDFGYSQVSLGLQLDSLYTVNQITDFIYGARYIYFVPRKASDATCSRYKLTIGNIGDLLVALKHQWNKHGLEYGYSARFNFGAHICPKMDDFAKKTNYTRSNFYLVYKYKFLINDIPNRFLLNISYGFDSKPKVFGNRRIVLVWASWSVDF